MTQEIEIFNKDDIISVEDIISSQKLEINGIVILVTKLKER